MKVNSSDGCEISFDAIGSGKALILLHGFSQSGNMWSRFDWPERLAKERFVVSMDMRGCGHSEFPQDTDSYSIEHHIADVDAVAKGLDIDEYSIWGWSLGGTLALHLAKRTTVISFALISGTYFGKLFTDQYIEQRLKTTKDEHSRTRWAGLRSWPGVEPADIHCDTCVYSGSNDGNVVNQLNQQRESIESAGIELRIFPGLNHGELVSQVDIVGGYVDSKLPC